MRSSVSKLVGHKALIPGSIIILALLVGPLAHAQTTVFFEGFEGAFPGNWTVADYDSDGFPAYWSDVPSLFGSVSAHSGSWKGYCAGVGYSGTQGSPQYQDDMFAEMARSANLTGATSASLTFWYNIPSIEEGVDICAAFVDDTVVWTTSAPTFGWQQATVDLSAYVGGTHIISFDFASDFSLVGEGWYLDDIAVTVTVVQEPNLTPYQPPGWSDKIVVSKVTGTRTDDSNLQPGDSLYVDAAVVNNGAGPVNATFRTEVYVDNALRTFWSSSPPVPTGAYTFISDYSLGSLSAGTHTIRVKTDSNDAIAESNETDNEYTKTITISGTPDIRITPLTLNFNITNSPGGGAAAPQTSLAGPGEIQMTAEQQLLVRSEARRRFDAGEERLRVIVNLVSPAGKPQGPDWDAKEKLQAWQRAIRSRQDDVLSALPAAEFRLRHRFENQSGFSGAVTREGFERLARHPRVASIQWSREVEPYLAQGIPLMNAAVYRSTYDGSGVSVAIVDSGVDYTHPRLGGAAFPNTKVIGGYDFGNLDTNPGPDSDAHGTECAGIAAGSLGTVGDYIGGVAPNAKIYSLKITDVTGSAFDDDIIAAWNWCVTHKNDDPANPLLVISTSFGSDRYFSACDASQTAFATAANNAVAAGLTLFVATGNNGYCDSIGSPACVSGVISVGGVYDAAYGDVSFCIDTDSCVSKFVDFSCPSGFGTGQTTAADKVTSYSNTSSFMDLLAPSHRAYTTDIVGTGGSSSGDYNPSFGGTSAACPYAAGAAVALQSAARATLGRFLTPAEVRLKLVSTGDLVTDTKAGITKPRINLGHAIETLGQNSSFTIFNDGNATLTVTSITPDSPAPWLILTPSVPYTIAPGGAQIVAVSLNGLTVPAGLSTRRLLVNSNDSDESPYPGGVFINVTNAAAGPTLHASLSAAKVVISWPTNFTGYILQSTDTLPGSSWLTVSPSPVVIGNQYFVTNAISGKKFYRLRK
jgi:subtilisin family serine protease